MVQAFLTNQIRYHSSYDSFLFFIIFFGNHLFAPLVKFVGHVLTYRVTLY